MLLIFYSNQMFKAEYIFNLFNQLTNTNFEATAFRVISIVKLTLYQIIAYIA